MKADEFERVLLADGREGVVIDIYVDPPGYEVEFSSPETGALWTEGVAQDAVVRNLGPATSESSRAS